MLFAMFMSRQTALSNEEPVREPSVYGDPQLSSVKDGTRWILPKSTSCVFTLRVDGEAAPGTRDVMLDVLIPQSIPERQEILDIRYSSRPTQVLKQDDNAYAQFRFDQPPRQFSVVITVKATLYRYDLTIAKARLAQREPETLGNRLDYLRPEEKLESTAPLIEQAARRCRGGSEEDTIRSIIAFVCDALSVSRHSVDGGALLALQKGEANCKGFSELFIALCRANGLASRFCDGYVVADVMDPSRRHGWAEVFLEKYGWVPMDALWIKERYASTDWHEPIYIYMVRHRRHEYLGENQHGRSKSRGGRVDVRIQFALLSRQANNR